MPKKRLLAVSLAVITALTMPTHINAQAAQPNDQGSVTRRPSSHVVPLTREQKDLQRYLELFQVADMYADFSKQAAKKGDANWQEGWKTMFARKAGITQEQAEVVKTIGDECYADEQANAQASRAALDAWVAANPGRKRWEADTPEVNNLRAERWKIVGRAVIKLQEQLGERTFTQLDGYSRHIHDNDLNRVQSQAVNHPGGAK